MGRGWSLKLLSPFSTSQFFLLQEAKKSPSSTLKLPSLCRPLSRPPSKHPLAGIVRVLALRRQWSFNRIGRGDTRRYCNRICMSSRGLEKVVIWDKRSKLACLSLRVDKLGLAFLYKVNRRTAYGADGGAMLCCTRSRIGGLKELINSPHSQGVS